MKYHKQSALSSSRSHSHSAHMCAARLFVVHAVCPRRSDCLCLCLWHCVCACVCVCVCARDTAQLICIFYWLPFNYLHFTEFLATAGTSRASLNSPPSSPSCWPQPSWPPVNCPGKCSRLPFDRRSLCCIYFQLILIKRCTGQRGGRGQVCVRTAYTYKHILERLIANCKMHKIVIYFLVLSFAYAQWAKTMQKCIKKNIYLAMLFHC